MSTVNENNSELLWVILEKTEAMVLSTVDADGKPYSTPVFFAVHDLIGTGPMIVFASKENSTHIRHLSEGSLEVAIGAYSPIDGIKKLKGIQARGSASMVGDFSSSDSSTLRNAYLKRFPMAAAILAKAKLMPAGQQEKLYAIRLSWAKITDNEHIGFGKHLEFTM